jgi:hypothetical protein
MLVWEYHHLIDGGEKEASQRNTFKGMPKIAEAG